MWHVRDIWETTTWRVQRFVYVVSFRGQLIIKYHRKRGDFSCYCQSMSHSTLIYCYSLLLRRLSPTRKFTTVNLFHVTGFRTRNHLLIRRQRDTIWHVAPITSESRSAKFYLWPFTCWSSRYTRRLQMTEPTRSISDYMPVIMIVPLQWILCTADLWDFFWICF